VFPSLRVSKFSLAGISFTGDCGRENVSNVIVVLLLACICAIVFVGFSIQGAVSRALEDTVATRLDEIASTLQDISDKLGEAPDVDD
jgi:hypothetical protein